MPNTPDTTKQPQRPRGWSEWYRFARDELEFSHHERVEYANHRYVEEQNRASLRFRNLGVRGRAA